MALEDQLPICETSSSTVAATTAKASVEQTPEDPGNPTVVFAKTPDHNVSPPNDDAEYQWSDSVVGCGSNRPESMFRDLTEHKERRRRHTWLVGVAALAIFLFSFVLYVIVSTERLKQPPPPETSLTGTYAFSKWEGDTLGYLTSLDLSQFIASIVIHRTEENVTITEPTMLNPNWTFFYTGPFGSHFLEFEMGTVFSEIETSVDEVSPNKMSHLCLQKSALVLHCWTNATDWRVKSEFVFDDQGFVETKTNLEDQKTCTKHYVKLRPEYEDLVAHAGVDIFNDKDIQEIDRNWMAVDV